MHSFSCLWTTHTHTHIHNCLSARLHGLCAVPLDAVGEGPALVLELLVLTQLDAVLGHDGQGVDIKRPGITVEEDLHALANTLDGLLARHVRDRGLVRHETPHDGLRQHAAEAGGQGRRGEGGAQQVGGGEERGARLVETGDQQVVPERVELGPAVVEELRQVLVQIPRVQRRLGARRRRRARVRLVDGELGQVSVEVLHVGYVAAEPDDRGLGERAETLDVCEPG